MTRFSDQLLDDLMREHGPALENAGPAAATGRRPGLRRAAVVTGGAGTLAVGLTVGLTAFGGGSPAYAVTQHPDGSLNVTVSDVSGIAGANQKLHSLGKHGQQVVVVPARAGCPPVDSLPAPRGQARQGAEGGTANGDGPGNVTSGGTKAEGDGQGNVTSGNKAKGGPQSSVHPDGKPGGRGKVGIAEGRDGALSVQAQDIPPGDLLVIAVSGTGHSTQLSARLTSGHAPSCVSLPAPGGQVHPAA